MTRIAFISVMEALPWGGSEELWSQAALRLAQRGVEVGVNVARHDSVPTRISELMAAGCQVARRPWKETLWRRAAHRVFGERATRWLDSFRPDLAVISQGENLSGAVWMQACAKRGIPYAAIVQAATANYWPSEERRTGVALAYANASASFFVSEANVELTRRQVASCLPNAQVVRNPFKVNFAAAPPWPACDTGFKLACVARLEPAAKGQDLLFEVLRADKWQSRPIHVDIYGEGYASEGLRHLAQMYGLKNVSFAGFAEDIEAVWATHHALILPSRYEGLPLALVEAMLCGRPIIVTDVGGNAEIVEDNISGFIAAAPEARWLDEALERAWQARERWQAMGQAAAQRVREQVPPDPVGAFLQKLMPLVEAK